MSPFKTKATANSRLADTSLLGTFAITDKILMPGRRGLIGNHSRYYGLSLLRTVNDVPRVSAITRVDCILNDHERILNFLFLKKLVSFIVNFPVTKTHFPYWNAIVDLENCICCCFIGSKALVETKYCSSRSKEPKCYVFFKNYFNYFFLFLRSF